MEKSFKEMLDRIPADERKFADSEGLSQMFESTYKCGYIDAFFAIAEFMKDKTNIDFKK